MARWGLARVHGRSMAPTLSEGDRLLLRHDATPRPGDVVVVRLPPSTTNSPASRTVAVKRATVLLPEGWWVERDNPEEGVDSARVGAIPVHDVVAVAPYRLWPRPRRLRRTPRP